MSLAGWVRAHAVQAAVVGVGLVALVAGSLVPPPRADGDEAGAGDWRLPPQATIARTDDAAFATVRSAPIWGAAAPGASGSVKAPSWKLTGIIARPVPTALVVASGSRQVLPLRAGGSLPDGGVVTSVSSGSLSYTRDGCRFERALYTVAETLLDGACAVPAATPAPPPNKAPTP
jgi:hypothetical protein